MLERVCPGRTRVNDTGFIANTAVGTDARIGRRLERAGFGKGHRGNAHLASPRGKRRRCAMARLTLIKLCRFSQSCQPR